MGDPGLGAVDAISVAVAHRTGRDRGEVGAGAGLGKDRCRQYLPRGDRRQPARLLRLGAVEPDQLAGDLGPRAERTDAEIAPRQLFGDDAHRGLAEPEPAIFLGDGQTEDAHPGQFLDQRQRDQLVPAVPILGEGRDRALGETAHLVADHVEGGIVETGPPECRCTAFGEKRAEPRAGRAQPRRQRPGRARAQRRRSRPRSCPNRRGGRTRPGPSGCRR